MNIKGFRTYLAAAALAGVPGVTAYVGGIDWSKFMTDVGVPSNFVVPAATVASALVMGLMRSITSTPPGQAIHPDAAPSDKRA